MTALPPVVNGRPANATVLEECDAKLDEYPTPRRHELPVKIENAQVDGGAVQFASGQHAPQAPRGQVICDDVLGYPCDTRACKRT